ncbi:hypothetical protein CHCC15091_1760 [Bacillus licheniformis]|uniref:hypothetical protein n=1 Tax=Bacillota TaxID=1239 RepID=UPI001388D358|nr:MULTISPECIES: hypothetical protein [Bacillota]TWM14719.1 hypothetical protein CHCC15091_1760 [Bacillus licheniformis]GIN25557.1 hypothetical protein J31TS2_21370 [Bacillus licheniformis]GIN29704.1 hypothetical protein J2TS5_17430 [Bacillus licheniformis]
MTKTKKYVRILKAPNKASWYADKIGQVFEVEREGVNYLTRTRPNHLSAIRKEDAELIVTEKRPAKVGEKVLVIDPPELNTYILPYEKAEVVGTFSNSPIERDYSGVFVRVVLGKLPKYLSDEQYEVIINNEVKNEEADEMENKLLIENAKTVFEKKGDKYFGYKSRLGDIVIGGNYSYAFIVHYAKTNEDVVIIPGDVNAVTTPVCTTEEERLWKPEKTAQERRDEIVEQAKADIANLNYRTFGELRYSYRSIVCNVEFVINKKKRTVVALLKSVGRGTVESKGIAKAAPDDCFNEHIGKAIALHRALGLEVPDEYLNAPNPTEVRVGDILTISQNGEMFDKIHYKVNSVEASEENLTIIKDELTNDGVGRTASADFSAVKMDYHFNSVSPTKEKIILLKGAFNTFVSELMIIDDSRTNS